MGRAKDLEDDSIERSVFMICLRRLRGSKVEILAEARVVILSGAEYSPRYSPIEGAMRRFLVKARSASEKGLLTGRTDVYIETWGPYWIDMRIPPALTRFAGHLGMPIHLAHNS